MTGEGGGRHRMKGSYPMETQRFQQGNEKKCGMWDGCATQNPGIGIIWASLHGGREIEKSRDTNTTHTKSIVVPPSLLQVHAPKKCLFSSTPSRTHPHGLFNFLHRPCRVALGIFVVRLAQKKGKGNRGQQGKKDSKMYSKAKRSKSVGGCSK